MYKSIYVPVDNSDHSNRAVAIALALGKAYSAKLVGCHVYAAKLHDYRFRQMEYTLPEEYIDEVELERQRKIHDSLITMGLKLISDSYLDGMSRLCKESSLEFEPRMMDGKHHIEILKDLAGSQHDLVVIGALGIGRARPPEKKATSTCASIKSSSPRMTRWCSVIDAPFTSSGAVVTCKTSSMHAGLRNSICIERTTKAKPGVSCSASSNSAR